MAMVNGGVIISCNIPWDSNEPTLSSFPVVK